MRKYPLFFCIYRTFQYLEYQQNRGVKNEKSLFFKFQLLDTKCPSIRRLLTPVLGLGMPFSQIDKKTLLYHSLWNTLYTCLFYPTLFTHIFLVHSAFTALFLTSSVVPQSTKIPLLRSLSTSGQFELLMSWISLESEIINVLKLLA